VGFLIYKENTRQQALYLETELESFTSKINSILATYEVFSQYVFEEIWKGRLFAKPIKNKIQNNVIIFKLKID
jgi:hypothetical protein